MAFMVLLNLVREGPQQLNKNVPLCSFPAGQMYFRPPIRKGGDMRLAGARLQGNSKAQQPKPLIVAPNKLTKKSCLLDQSPLSLIGATQAQSVPCNGNGINQENLRRAKSEQAYRTLLNE